MPFYKPLASLEIFERMLKQTSIATGNEDINSNPDYRSSGPAESTYRNDNSTIQTQVIDSSCTYNTVTDLPECP